MRQEYIEEGYVDSLQKKSFFDRVEYAKIDMSQVSVKKKEYNEHYHRFNILIDRMVSDGEITLFEIALYLFQDYFDEMSDVLNCFDENNQWALREESSVRYHKGSLKNILDNFLF